RGMHGACRCRRRGGGVGGQGGGKGRGEDGREGGRGGEEKKFRILLRALRIVALETRQTPFRRALQGRDPLVSQDEEGTGKGDDLFLSGRVCHAHADQF